MRENQTCTLCEGVKAGLSKENGWHLLKSPGLLMGGLYLTVIATPSPLSLLSICSKSKRLQPPGLIFQACRLRMVWQLKPVILIRLSIFISLLSHHIVILMRNCDHHSLRRIQARLESKSGSISQQALIPVGHVSLCDSKGLRLLDFPLPSVSK